MDKIFLKGITWNHTRGVTPLLAASQRFAELHPGVEIGWEKRSLQQFADFSIEELSSAYDLIIIDHPWVGRADASKCLVPLERELAPEFLNDLAENSIGSSWASYTYNGHQYALPVDAASPVASYREDLLIRNGVSKPETWQELISLGQKKKLAIPSVPIDILMYFYMFCIAYDRPPFAGEEIVIEEETGIEVLNVMDMLWSFLDKRMFKLNPIQVAELMAGTDEFWYCPFSFGYSNYSRRGYAAHILTYADLIRFNDNSLQGTLGGTGIAVSSSAKNKEWAIRYATWITSPDIQSTLYIENGGQPSYAPAWKNNLTNRLCNNFFTNTFLSVDNSYLRPRYENYLYFQDRAGVLLFDFLSKKKSVKPVLTKLNQLYRKSKENH